MLSEEDQIKLFFDTGMMISPKVYKDARIVLPVTPRSYVQVTNAIKKAMRIPERCRYMPTLERHYRFDKDGPLEDIDVRIMGCELWNNTGFCRHTSNLYTRRKKKSVFKYNDYKREVKRLCDEAGFKLIDSGWSLYFYYPIPKHWSKKKKLLMRGQKKKSKPDIDNLTKAVFDSLGKKRGEDSDRIPDEQVAQLSGSGKFWLYDIDARDGYIEILIDQPIYNPFNVIFID